MATKNKHDDTLTRGRVNLMANQAGKITAQQKDWLRRDMRDARRKYNQQIAISGIVFLVVAVVFALLPFVVIPVAFVPIIWLVCVLAWVAYAWYQQKPIRDDLNNGVVATATGYIDKSQKHGYHITIDGVDYATPPDMYEAFSDTAQYTVYVTPQSKIVLSADLIAETDDDFESDDPNPEASRYPDDSF